MACCAFVNACQVCEQAGRRPRRPSRVGRAIGLYARRATGPPRRRRGSWLGRESPCPGRCPGHGRSLRKCCAPTGLLKLNMSGVGSGKRMPSRSKRSLVLCTRVRRRRSRSRFGQRPRLRRMPFQWSRPLGRGLLGADLGEKRSMTSPRTSWGCTSSRRTAPWAVQAREYPCCWRTRNWSWAERSSLPEVVRPTSFGARHCSGWRRPRR